MSNPFPTGIDTVFAFVRTSEELLPGKLPFEEAIALKLRQRLGRRVNGPFGHPRGEVHGGEPINWPTFIDDIRDVMTQTGAQLVEVTGEFADEPTSDLKSWEVRFVKQGNDVSWEVRFSDG